MFDEWMSRTKENQGLPWTVSFFAEEKGAKHLLGGPLKSEKLYAQSWCNRDIPKSANPHTETWLCFKA